MAARQKLPYWCKLSNKNSPQILLSNSRSMFILNLNYCDFFIWSPAISTDYPNYLKIYVEKNDAFINDMSVKLQNYFLKVLLPEVVTRKNDICTDNMQKYYCICRRPCFEPMIACDAKHCDIE